MLLVVVQEAEFAWCFRKLGEGLTWTDREQILVNLVAAVVLTLFLHERG